MLVYGYGLMAERLIPSFLCSFRIGFQELYAKLHRMSAIAAEMFVGRERFSTMLLMRLTETVILWLSEDQTFWEDIEEGPRPLGPLGLQQVFRLLFFWSKLHFSPQCYVEN